MGGSRHFYFRYRRRRVCAAVWPGRKYGGDSVYFVSAVDRALLIPGIDIDDGCRRPPFVGTTTAIDGLGEFNIKAVAPDTSTKPEKSHPVERRVGTVPGMIACSGGGCVAPSGSSLRAMPRTPVIF